MLKSHGAFSAPMTTRAPQLTLEQAEDLALRLYGVEGKALEFASERDQNFRIETAEGSEVLLKVSNSAESDEVIDLQTRAMEHVHVADPTFPAPRMIRSKDGLSQQRVQLVDGQWSIIRLLTFLPGKPLYRVEQTTLQRRNLGRCLAQLDQALAEFTHPGAHHDLLWNISRADQLEPLIAEVTDSAQLELVKRFMAAFKHHALPRLPALPAQVIHNDLNLYNVLVDPQDTNEITGVIDFGDIIHAPRINELAVAAAYQLTDPDDRLGSASEFIGAYHEVLPLTPEECEVLPDLVAARLLITVLITEWRAARYPANRTYILRNNAPAWASLAVFGALTRDQIRDRLLAGCRFGGAS